MNSMGHALVIGGSKGLGRIVAERFLNRNFKVTILSRKKILLDNKNQSNINYIEVDLETLKNGISIVKQTIEINGLVNYIIFCQRYRGEKNNVWDREIQVTLTSTNLLIEAFADNFSSEGDKAITVVSSVYAHSVGSSQPLSYHVAKAGLNQLVKYYAFMLGEKGIRINSIMPLTYLKKENNDFYKKNLHLMKIYNKLVPLKRIGNVNDSANIIEFLCSENASFINGQSIFVDGGTSVVWQEEIVQSIFKNSNSFKNEQTEGL